MGDPTSEQSGHSDRTLTDAPAPIEWATLPSPSREDDPTEIGGWELPAWVPPPPGALATRDARPVAMTTAVAGGNGNGASSGDHPHDRDERDDPIDLREILSSRGARFLAVVAVCTITLLVAGTVLLWQRVESAPRADAQPSAELLADRELTDIRRRLSRIETQIAATLDATGTTVTTTPAPLLYQLELLRRCVVEFQQAIDSGRSRFTYC